MENTIDKTKAIIDKIQKLLNLSENNPSSSEAESAMLKAQALMAEYNVSVAKSMDPEAVEKIVSVGCEHKKSFAYRGRLAGIIGENFGCAVYFMGGQITFYGHKTSAYTAKEVFEYAYLLIYRNGSALYHKAKVAGERTVGVLNSYALGFLAGLKEKLDRQCVALAIVVPQDVKEGFAIAMKDAKAGKDRMQNSQFDFDAFRNGVKDGKNFTGKKPAELTA